MSTQARQDYPSVLDVVLETDPSLVERVVREVEDLPDGVARDILTDVLASAMRVRQEVEQLRRRERELQILFDTASDLSSLKGVNDILESIVLRVRRFFGADSGYMALVDDETGDAFMRITSGTVTSEIEHVRLAPGEGIGGRIIETGRPFVTEDYFNDPAIKHSPAVTQAVRLDGIRSIGGAPIILRHKVIGALFIANRERQRYGAAEMALLSSLADHVAILLENASLFEAQQSATETLAHTNEALQAQAAQLQQAADFHARLTSLVLERTSRQRYTAIVADLLDAAVVYSDEHGAALASSGEPAIVQDLLHRADMARQEDRVVSAGAESLVQGSDTQHLWWVSVRAGSAHFGYLLFALSHAPTAADVQRLEQAAQTAALLELIERRTMLEEEELRGELLDDLLAERPPVWESFSRRAERAGVSIFSSAHRVMVLSADGETTRRQLVEACLRFSAPRGGIAAEYAGDVIMILPEEAFGQDVGSFMAEMKVEVERRLRGSKVTGGVAGPACSGPGLRGLYHEAVRYLHILHALGRTGTIVDRDSLGALGLVIDGTSRPLVEAMLERNLGPLLRYDQEHNALLVETLQAYFESGQNPRAAASGLFVHANTVYQRLSRIDQVLGTDGWRQPEGALEMQLALQFHRLINGVPPEMLFREAPKPASGTPPSP